MEAVLRNKFKALSAYIKILEKCHLSNLITHLKPLGKDQERGGRGGRGGGGGKGSRGSEGGRGGGRGRG